MKLTLSIAALILSVSGSVANAGVVLDTITPGTWQNHPNWGLPMELNNSGSVVAGISITGNGQILERFGMVVSLWDGSTQALNPSANDLFLRFDVFSSAAAFMSADWSPGSTALQYTVPVMNQNWITPIGSYGGVNYYFAEVNLLDLGLHLPSGQSLVLGAAFVNADFGNPYTVVAQGATGSPFGGDSYVFEQLGYFGSSEGFLAQYGFPPVGGPVTGVTNLAVTVSTVPAPSALVLLAISGFAVHRRRR
jgi:hypothetical protein